MFQTKSSAAARLFSTVKTRIYWFSGNFPVIPRVDNNHLTPDYENSITIAMKNLPFPNAQSSVSLCLTLLYMADIVFMLLFRHCLPRYFVCSLINFRTYTCIMACFTLRALFNMGADLKIISI